MTPRLLGAPSSLSLSLEADNGPRVVMSLMVEAHRTVVGYTKPNFPLTVSVSSTM